MSKRLEYRHYVGLQVFCQKCKRSISTKKKTKVDCNHPIDRQIYKASIGVPNATRVKTKNLKATTFDEAVVELIKFKREVENPELYIVKKEDKPTTLTGCVSLFLDYMQDVDVPHHEKKYLSDTHIVSVKGELKDFMLFIKDNISKDLENYKIEDINKNIVGKYCEYVEKKNQSNRTYNGRITTLKALFNYLIDEKQYKLINVWKFKLKPIKSTNESISEKEFLDVINAVSQEDSVVKVGKSNKNRYRPWLKDFFRLKAYTGLRNKGIRELKFNMVYFENDIPVYVKSPNWKIIKQKNILNESDYEYVYIPIGEELKPLLYDLGLNENINSNRYILDPENNKRKAKDRQATSSFTFYWERLNRPQKKTLKFLRKTYATREGLFYRPHKSTLHKNIKTTEKYYTDYKEVAKQMVKDGFRVFPKEDSDI